MYGVKISWSKLFKRVVQFMQVIQDHERVNIPFFHSLNAPIDNLHHFLTVIGFLQVMKNSLLVFFDRHGRLSFL